jgi:mono/diheme cytochrome c family protein
LAAAGEPQVTLKAGEGRALVEANCVMCHSLDYVPMNSVFLDRKGWEASVNKMIKVMGAPIRQEDIAPIIDYLTRNYGK